jgi:hypothetical protein
MKKILLLVLVSAFLPVFASAAICNSTECTGTLDSGLETGLSAGIGSNPAASVISGTYHSARTVTISAPDASRILYTTNGNTPACTSTGNIYDSALTINSDTTLKVVACYNFNYGVSSSVVTYTYYFTCTISSVTHGNVAAYSGCAITCNTGYALSGNHCIYSGGGGGGGGGLYIPPSTTTVPVTQMTIAQLQAEILRITTLIAQLQAKLAELLGGAAIEGIPAGFSFEKNLEIGDVLIDVKYLQIVLNSDPITKLAESGVGSPGNETNYFGPLIKSAVIKFQEKYADKILASWGLTSGTGYVGSTTRDKLNELLGR